MPRKKIAPEVYLFTTLPSDRRQEIVNEALGGQLRAAIAGAESIGAFLQSLKAHPRWDYIHRLPLSSLLHVAAAYHNASAPSAGAASTPVAAAVTESAPRTPVTFAPAAAPSVSTAPARAPAPATSTPAVPRKTPKKTPKAKAARPARAPSPSAAASTPAKKKAGSYARRSPQEIEAIVAKVLGFIAKNPGLRTEAILKQVGGDKGAIKDALSRLRDEKKVKTTGIKRAMTYQVG